MSRRATVKELGDLLGEGDVVVDGGNSRWTDDLTNAELLREKGVGYVDCGVSGGAGEGLIGFEGTGLGGVRRTTTRLLDGEFPKVRSLFPAEHLTVAKVNKAELIETVKRVALVAERNTAVQMKFGDNQIVLDAGSGDEAMATEAVDADINGDDLTTGFNPQFLLDGLTAIDGEMVDLAFTQATKPVVISGTDADDDTGSFRYLLMPRRLLS